ncbi:MAG: hypothetical protein M1820_003989 [Bogoriella megaspora]|nr:MAG: hypothetical protein M1820_003989 [Bogoriella megaspora]
MAEVVGLVASILTLAETGFKISRSLLRIADDFGYAGSQLKAIGVEVRALSFVLQELRRRLQRLPVGSQEAVNVAVEVVALAKTDVNGIEDLLESLRPYGGQTLSLKMKFKWTFWKKSKFNLKRASLESLKLTLTMLMHTLDCIESGEVNEYVQEEVNALVDTSKDTFKTLVQANFTDLKHERNSDSSETLLDALPRRLLEYSTIPNVDDEVVLSLSTSPSALAPSQSRVFSKARRSSSAQSDSETEWNAMREMTEDDFLSIAEHLRVQRCVVRFASDVMQPSSIYLRPQAQNEQAGTQLPNQTSANAKSITFCFDEYQDFSHNLRFYIPATTSFQDVHNTVLQYSSCIVNPNERKCITDRQYLLLNEDNYIIDGSQWPEFVNLDEGRSIKIRLHLTNEYIEELFFYHATDMNKVSFKWVGVHRERLVMIARNIDETAPWPDDNAATVEEKLMKASETVEKRFRETGITKKQRTALHNFVQRESS